MTPTDAEIAAEILRQTGANPVGSVSPNDVAVALAPQWRGLLSRVRRIAVTLAQQGSIEILRKGRPIAPEEMRGVIRLRHKPEGTP
jgi:hypothetical protein